MELTAPGPVVADGWQLDVTFEADPTPGLAAACDTNDGCAGSCASACVSS